MKTPKQHSGMRYGQETAHATLNNLVRPAAVTFLPTLPYTRRSPLLLASQSCQQAQCLASPPPAPQNAVARPALLDHTLPAINKYLG